MRRRWKQISLRSLLLVVTICAVLLVLWTAYIQPYRQEQGVLAELKDKQFAYTSEAIGPGWLQWLADGKYAQRVVRVDIGNDVTDDDLARLQTFAHLRSVIIADGRQITDAGLEQLVKNRSIEELDLGHTQVTNHGLRHLQQLPNLRALLVVGGQSIDDTGLGHIARNPRLVQLRLGDTQISDDGLRQLRGLPRLRELYLASRGITDAGLEQIGQLTELRELTLRANVTDAGMPHLKPLANLETLRLAGFNKQVAKLQSELKMQTQLEFVRVPLVDACDFLADLHAVLVRIDEPALEAAGMKATLPVTAAERGKPLQEVLPVLLAPHELDWVIDSGGLLITTREEAARRRPGITELRRALPKLREVDVPW